MASGPRSASGFTSSGSSAPTGQPGSLSRYYPLILLLVLLLGLGLRVSTYHGLRESDPGFFSLGLDSRYFVDWARSIADGDVLCARGFPGERPFFMNPLYPYFISPIVLWAGEVQLIVLVIRILQVALGTLTILLVADASRRLLGRPTGLLAGLFTAVYPLLLYYEQRVMIVTLAVFLNALTLWFLARLKDRPRLRTALLAGLPLGLSVLARPNVILFVLLLPLWLRRIAPPGPWLRFAATRTGALLIGVVVMILPVALRNYFVGKDTVAVTSSMGVNLWQSNNPAGWESGWMFSLELRSSPVMMEDDSIRIAKREIAREEIARRESGRALYEGELNEWWRGKTRTEVARREIAQHAVAWRAILEAELGRTVTDAEVDSLREERARRLLAMRALAMRRVALREIARRETGRQLSPAEVERHWRGRQITEDEVAAQWLGQEIRAPDIEPVYRQVTPDEVAAREAPELEQLLGPEPPAPADVYEVLTPRVNEYWRARARREVAEADLGRALDDSGIAGYWEGRRLLPEQEEPVLRRHVDEYWAGRRPEADAVRSFWGETELRSHDIRRVVRSHVAAYWRDRELPASRVSSWWSAHTRRTCLSRLPEAVGYVIRKFFYFFRGFEMPSSYYFAVEKGHTVPLKWIPLTFSVLSPLMVLGGLFIVRSRRDALPLPFFVAAYAVGLTIFYPLAHYRAPMLPAAIPLAAFAVVGVLDALRTDRGRRTVGILAGLGACVLFTMVPPVARELGFKRFAGRLDDRTIFYYNRGMYLLGEDRPEVAARLFRWAIEANPKARHGWMGLAAVAEARGELDTEELYLERALEVSLSDHLSQEEADQLYRRWRALAQEGRFIAAENLLWEVSEKHPRSVLPHIWLAQLAFGRTSDEVWKDHLRNGVTLRSGILEVWARLGRNWFARGDTGPGLFLAETAAERRGRDELVQALLGELYVNSGDFEAALAQYRAAERSAEHLSPTTIAYQALCLRKLGRLDDAAREVARGLAWDPRSPALRVERALLLLARGEDPDTVRRAVRTAVECGATLPEELKLLLED